ncbi:hypothetical protein BX666DRAFT_1939238 [Dichotomocladium elegans]|nr:hypothetical protein BX666DRAFT_1939238 [Dichotomocladium elegans]
MGSTASKQAAAASAPSAVLNPCPNTNVHVLENPILINRHNRKAVGCDQPHSKKKLMMPLFHRKPEPNELNASDNKTSKRNKKHKKKQNVTSLSTKRNPKYKRVTKSIIGKPTNFQHVSYVGRDGPIEPRSHGLLDVDDEVLAGQLLDIAARLDASPSDQAKKEPQPKDSESSCILERPRSPRSSGPPPPPPPHWSTLALRQIALSEPSLQSTRLFEDISAYTSKKYNKEHQNVEKNSISRRRPPRKNQSNIPRQRFNRYSSEKFGMPPSLRLGPSR